MQDLRGAPRQPRNQLLVHSFVLIMRWMLSFLMCWSASAQLPVIPYMLPSGGISRDLSGVAYLWVSSDLASNATITGSWTDRIQGSVFNAPAANQPTNGSTSGNDPAKLGIWIDTTHLMTNVNQHPPLATNMSLGIIFNLVDPKQNYGGIVSMTGATGAIDSDETYLGCLATQGRLRMYPTDASSHDMSDVNFGSLTNAVCDLVVSTIATAGPVINFKSYTNGIFSLSVAIGHNGNQFTNFPNRIGNSPQNFGNAQKFRLIELWAWTNAANGTAPAGADISASQLAHFHLWATNHYGP